MSNRMQYGRQDMTRCIRTFALCFITAWTGSALAQTYPAKPVRLVVSTPAGGATDIIARAVTQRLAEMWGQQIIIENKVGANTQIGAEAVAKSAPDGYTLLATSETTLSVNPFLYRKLAYEAKDFTPISGMGLINQVLIVHPSVAAQNVADLISLAKAKPGEVNYGTLGIGSSSHLNTLMFESMAGVRLTLLVRPVRAERGGAGYRDQDQCRRAARSGRSGIQAEISRTKSLRADSRLARPVRRLRQRRGREMAQSHRGCKAFRRMSNQAMGTRTATASGFRANAANRDDSKPPISCTSPSIAIIGCSRCAGRGDLVGEKNFEPLPLEPRLIMAQAMKTAPPPAVLLENPAPPGGVFLWERGLAKRVHLRLAQPNRLIDCRAMIRGFSPGVQGRFVQSRSCRVRRS
jgi:hypothetical protein